MPALGFTDNDGIDVGNKYVTKDYVMTWYPDLAKNMLTPQLWTWGDNYYGQLGTNNVSSRSSPGTTISGGTNWKSVSSGRNFTAAIKTDGTLWTWGDNYYGQLGDDTITNRTSPVMTVAGGNNWKSVAGGYSHTAAIKTDGTLWTWGFNASGQLGSNEGSLYRSSPGTVTGDNSNWKSVACGYAHTAAIKTDGTLWTWGQHISGQLGSNEGSLYRSSPGTVFGGGTNWKSVACGNQHTAAIKTDGTLWACGYNLSGQLGTNDAPNRSSLIQTAGAGTNWKSVACGYDFTAAIKTDGTLWTWGSNGAGRLGNGNTTNSSSPGITAGAGTNWKSVACGSAHTAAIKTDGTLWTWGSNVKGQLGGFYFQIIGPFPRSSPGTTVTGGTNWKSVASGYRFTTAISESEGW